MPGDQDSYITTTAVTDGREKPEAEERYFTGKIKLDEIAERNGQHPDLPDEERHGPCPNNEHCIVDEWTDRDGKGGNEVKEEPGPYDHVSNWETVRILNYGMAGTISGSQFHRACMGFLGRRLAARTLPPVTIRELRLALQDEWAAMPQQLIDTLILSMGRRCETCLAVRGDPIPY
ncbi:hypothetical protein TNCV_2225241 [Trichonephila clavipes]|nr:hypothetical protein TNCV_2225241 [Trichonephila clavipes]